jgi:hypothetical protein
MNSLFKLKMNHLISHNLKNGKTYGLETLYNYIFSSMPGLLNALQYNVNKIQCQFPECFQRLTDSEYHVHSSQFYTKNEHAIVRFWSSEIFEKYHI